MQLSHFVQPLQEPNQAAAAYPVIDALADFWRHPVRLGTLAIRGPACCAAATCACPAEAAAHFGRNTAEEMPAASVSHLSTHSMCSRHSKLAEDLGRRQVLLLIKHTPEYLLSLKPSVQLLRFRSCVIWAEHKRASCSCSGSSGVALDHVDISMQFKCDSSTRLGLQAEEVMLDTKDENEIKPQMIWESKVARRPVTSCSSKLCLRHVPDELSQARAVHTV